MEGTIGISKQILPVAVLFFMMAQTGVEIVTRTKGRQSPKEERRRGQTFAIGADLKSPI
jgi:hypothetical protein